VQRHSGAVAAGSAHLLVLLVAIIVAALQERNM